MSTVYRAPREWTRLHPVSPLLGGWAVLGFVGAIIAYNAAPDWIGIDDGTREVTRFLTSSVALFLAGALVLVLAALGIGYLQWRFNQYQLTDEAMLQRTGVLFRQHRQARLDRLQAVDVVQPLLARIFGFAELRVEVAGGEGSSISLAYLRLGDAEALRNELLALAAGVKLAKRADHGIVDGTSPEQLLAATDEQTGVPNADADADGVTAAQHQAVARGSLREVAQGMPDGVPEVQAAAQREVYTVPIARLLASIVLSWAFLLLLSLPIWVAVVLVVAPIDFDDLVAFTIGASISTVLPAAIGVVVYFWSQLSRGFGFRAAISQDGIRLRHGLLETRRQTVPPGRVQAVQFTQSLLWRRQDWWRVTINVAGYQEEQENVSTLLPVGSRQDALTALWLVLPDLGDPDPAGTVSLALSGKGDDGGFTASPRRSAWFDPLQWLHRGVRATDRCLLIRRGLLVRHLYVVPHERTQSLSVSQGPLQRVAGLATFTVDSTDGPVSPVAAHLAVEDASALLDAQSERAAEGRRRATPEQWMSAVGLT